MEDTYNKSGYWTFLIVLIINILFFAYVSFIHEGVKPIDTLGKQKVQLEAPANESK